MFRYGILLSVTVVLSAHAVHADDASPPGFMSLVSVRKDAHGQVLPPPPLAPAQFFPLKNRQGFMPLPRRAQDVRPPATIPAAASGMTREEAQQILSLFAGAE